MDLKISEDEELKARELAQSTRLEGLGGLAGKFPQRLLQNQEKWGVWAFIEYFIKGEDIPQNDHATGIIIKRHTPQHLMHKIENEYRQVWTKSQYVPPMEATLKQEFTDRKIKTFFGLITKTTKEPELVRKTTDTPITYHGKKGENDWTQYDYYMPVDNSYDINNHWGNFVNMSIAVPPNLAVKINKEVEENIYFPDAFFKALYPGHIGQDTKENIKRIQATELLVVDLIEKPPTSEIRKYPQPIPY